MERLFKLSKTGAETVLYRFCSQSGCTDGAGPFGGLVFDAGGRSLRDYQFRWHLRHIRNCVQLSNAGEETVLYNFTGGADGGGPVAGLIRDEAGNLYGTAYVGGDLNCGYGGGCGTVFKLSEAGKATVLHKFSGGSSDGAYPNAGVIMDSKGNLYGATEGGRYDQGTVFKLSKSGKLTVLYSFAGGKSGGCSPEAPPARDKDGNLYGTTEACGPFGYGNVWKINKNRTESVPHNFSGGPSDGEVPYAGVIMDAKGNLYGDTQAGGVFDRGVVYELNRKGVLTVLHAFDGLAPDYPSASLIMDAEGNLYSTTADGGSAGYGSVWKLTP